MQTLTKTCIKQLLYALICLTLIYKIMADKKRKRLTTNILVASSNPTTNTIAKRCKAMVVYTKGPFWDPKILNIRVTW